jgi:hypothetical protein
LDNVVTDLEVASGLNRRAWADQAGPKGRLEIGGSTAAAIATSGNAFLPDKKSPAMVGSYMAEWVWLAAPTPPIWINPDRKWFVLRAVKLPHTQDALG